MLKYLTEVEDLMKGQDLKQIQDMMDVTKEGMKQHFDAYDKIKDQITTLGAQADEAIKSLNFYGGDKSSTDKGPSSYKQELARVMEEDYQAEQISKGNKASLEGNKKNIVNQLLNMNQSMREFTIDLESKLDRAYKSGAGKKYGYSSITNTAQQLNEVGDDTKQRKEDRMLNKMSNQAQSFLDKNSAASILGTQSYSQQGKKTSFIKALPSSEDGFKKSKTKTSKGINDDLKQLQN